MRRSPITRSALGVAAVGLAAVYPLVEAVRIVVGRSHRYLYGDTALIELSARRAADFNQLLGPYSRLGFHHPGPALFYLMAPFVTLLGSGPGVYLASILISGAALVAMTALVWRWAGATAALWTVAAIDVYCLCVRVFTLREPWNPYLVVAPMALLGLLAAGTVVGRRGAWIWAVAVASYEVQTHLSTGVVVVALVVLAGVAGLVRARRRRSWFASDGLGTARIVGFVAVVAVWTAPAVELVRDHPNNLTLLWRFYTSSHAQPSGSQALKAGANALAIVPFGNVDYVIVLSHPRWELAVTALLLLACWAATLLVARRRHQGLPVVLVAGAVVIAAGGIASLTRADGGINAYFATWLSTAPLLSLVGLLVAVLGRAQDPAMERTTESTRPAEPVHRRSGGSRMPAVLSAAGVLVAVVGTGLVVHSDLSMQSVRHVSLAPETAAAAFS
ncbi:MAG: hypothetical protein ACRDXE_02175, partial [Acidimicrobiales bacterium]